jgi:hypothetical protein
MEKHEPSSDALARVQGKSTASTRRKTYLDDTPIFVPEACYDWLADNIASNIAIDLGGSTSNDLNVDSADAANASATASSEAKVSDQPPPSSNSEHPLPVINAAELLQKPAKPMEFLLENTIPRNMFTGFFADGGAGKSTMALQLAASGALNMPWLGLPVARPFSTLYLSAEDNADICRERLLRIIEAMTGGDHNTYKQSMSRFWLLDATHGSEIDPLFASWLRGKGLSETRFYRRIKGFIAEKHIDLFIIDSAADVFDEEIDRTAVRSFIRALHALRCTVLLLGHPSVSGMKEGRGYSGSTHWHNAVRARLYMTKPSGGKDRVGDDDARVIDMPKSNYGPSGQKLRVRFDREKLVFVPEGQSGGDPDAGRQEREQGAQQRQKLIPGPSPAFVTRTRMGCVMILNLVCFRSGEDGSFKRRPVVGFAGVVPGEPCTDLRQTIRQAFWGRPVKFI